MEICHNSFINSLPTWVLCWLPDKMSDDWSGPKLFDTLMVFLQEFFEYVDFEKKSAFAEKACKIIQHAKLTLWVSEQEKHVQTK